VSRKVAVRTSSQYFDRYIEEARFIAKRELTNYRLRKLFEAGYPLRDAVTMLSAIEDSGDANAQSDDQSG